jgi:hypothetical protein
MVHHGTLPETTPMSIAAHPCTSPAAGVMHTRPVIMLWTAPMTERRPNTKQSRQSQTRRLVAVQKCVFTTASDASILAAYGAPPLNPVHPIHSRPAPASVRRMLFGGNASLSLAVLGPTCRSIDMLLYIGTFTVMHGRHIELPSKRR